MYYLNTLAVLTSTLTAAHSIHSTELSAASNSTAPLPTSARPIETVTVTVTKTLPPIDTPTISVSTTASHFAIPLLPTEGVHAGEHGAAGPGHNDTASRPYTLGHGPVMATSGLGFYPAVTTACYTDTSGGEGRRTDLPTFTLNPSLDEMTSIPSVDDFNTQHWAAEEYVCTASTGSARSSTARLSSSAAPGYSSPSSQSSASASMMYSSPMLPGSSTEYSNSAEQPAWAGTDNAIPAQVQEYALPRPSHTPLQSKSAAIPSVQKGWHDARRRDMFMGKNEEKRTCAPCEDEGGVACRGDVAIGVCKGGCVEMRFLGRGR